MDKPHRKRYGLIIAAVLLLVLLAAGGYVLVPAETYRVAIVPDSVVRTRTDGKLTFRYQWPESMIRTTHAAYACICFKRPQDMPTLVNCSGNAPKPEVQCHGFIKVARRGTDYQPYKINRQMMLSLDEANVLKPILAAQRHTFSLDLKPDGRGEMQIRKFYIDDVTLDELVKNNFALIAKNISTSGGPFPP